MANSCKFQESIDGVKIVVNTFHKNATAVTITQFEALGNMVRINEFGAVDHLFGATRPEDKRSALLQAMIELVVLKLKSKIQFPLLFSCSLDGPADDSNASLSDWLAEIAERVAKLVEQ